MRRMQANILVATAIAVLSLLIPTFSGCGGSAKNLPSENTSTEQLGATAHFTIRWPRTRAIPDGTNRIIIFVVHQEAKKVFAYIKDRTPSAFEDRVSVPIPYGRGITFSAEARRVSTIEYDEIRLVPIEHPDLLEGELLGSGYDKSPYDVFYNTQVSALIEVQTAGVPNPDTTKVDVQLSQVITDFFPIVLALQLVTDERGDPITNLNRGNFEVLEDGKPAVITDVRLVDQSATDLSVCLVLDRSGSMQGSPNAALEQAASTFVNLMRDQDYGAVINFSSRSSIQLSQSFTQNKNALLAAINGRTAAGSTALYSAIWLGLEVTSQQQGARAIIAMSDGADNNSNVSLNQVIARARQVGIPIFTVGLGDVELYPLQQLAIQTGGIYYIAPTENQLEDIYKKISAQLKGTIQISFISPDPQPRGRARNVVIRYRYGRFQGEVLYNYVY